MQFEYIVIDPQTPGIQNDVCLIADVNGDGYNDIIIGGKRPEDNFVWYEYPKWKRHLIGTASLEAGGVTIDITGNGLPDVVAGNPGDAYPKAPGRELYWFENPSDSAKQWAKYVITDEFVGQYHDQVVGDIDNDGTLEIVFASQKNGIIGYYDIPKNPRVCPWPKEYLHVICNDLKGVEGLVVADLDGDGKQELLAGPFWFRQVNDQVGKWEKRTICDNFFKTTAAVGDLNGDGKLEVVLAEGESHPAKLAWFSGIDFKEMHLLADDLFHPHSLAVADMDGDGLPDIFVGEMGLGLNNDPKILIYRNKGNGEFERIVVAQGHATHCAKVGDIGNTGRLSIVGKPYHPGRCVELWLNKG